MLPINKKISPYNNSSRNGNSIKYIVVHYTGNRGDTAKNNIDFFYRANRNASAHYFVDDNSIWQSVEDSRASWNCGDGNGKYGITNRNTLAIEMCCAVDGHVTAKTEANTLELVKYLQKKYGVPNSNVVRHYDASRKACPNWSANNWARWHNFKAKLAGTTVSTPTVNTPSVSTPSSDPYKKYADFVGSRCKELQTKLISLGYNCGGYGADGMFGKGTYDSLVKFQRDHGLAADGLAGTATFSKLDALITNKNNSSSNSSSNDWVRRLQSECNRQGFSSQAIDGIPGPNTLKGCPMLRQGNSGNITRLLQERLIALGFSCGSYGADGSFGNGTVNAVRNFQSSRGLDADGIVGTNTWRKLLGL